MKTLFIILAMLIFSKTFAADENVLVVIEKTTHIGIEQTGFSLKNGKIELTTNSNFLAKTPPYHFGIYEVKSDPDTINKILEVKKVEKLKEKEIFLSPHDITVYVNGKKVPANSKQFGAALAVNKMLFESKSLKLIDGVTIQKSSEIKKIKCEDRKNEICTFKYGYLHE